MGKNKVVIFHKDKLFREEVKRLAPEEPLSEIEEEKIWDEIFKTPLGHKIALKLQKLKAEGAEDAEINRTLLKMLYEEKKELQKLHKNTEKEMKEEIIGIRNNKGGITCIDCIDQKVWAYIDEEKAVTFLDFIEGLTFQCDNCKEKFNLHGTDGKWPITFIRFIPDKVSD